MKTLLLALILVSTSTIAFAWGSYGDLFDDPSYEPMHIGPSIPNSTTTYRKQGSAFSSATTMDDKGNTYNTTGWTSGSGRFSSYTTTGPNNATYSTIHTTCIRTGSFVSCTTN